jgi:hypothetical protein
MNEILALWEGLPERHKADLVALAIWLIFGLWLYRKGIL